MPPAVKTAKNLYLNISQSLGTYITYPAGYPNLLKNHLLMMYTRASTDDMKRASSTMSIYSQENRILNLVIAATSFSMGIDIPDVHEIIHQSPPSDLEQYVQEIGCAGRNGKDSVHVAVLIFEKSNRYTKQGMILYAECNTECRWKNLFNHFIKYEHCDSLQCKCCDICEFLSDCTICKVPQCLMYCC